MKPPKARSRRKRVYRATRGDYATVAARSDNPEATIFSSRLLKSHLRNQKRKQSIWTAFFVFGTMCSAYAERDAHFVRDVAFGSDVRFAREYAEHITSLCAIGAIHHCAIAQHRLPARANITLYKRMILCYNYLINTKGSVPL